MDSRRIEAVLFDLGETLLNFGKLERAALFDEAVSRSYAYLKELAQPVGSMRAYRHIHIWGIRWHLFRSWLTGDDFNSLELLKAYGQKRGFMLSPQQWEELNWQWYAGLSRRGAVEKGTTDALRCLRDMDLKLGLLSNTFVHKSSLERHLKQEGLLDLLPVRVYSYEFPYRKPDVRIFAAAAEKMGVPARHTVYVGDRMDNDVRGAQAAGMLPILKRAYTNKDRDIPAHIEQIETLVQLPQCIRQLGGTSLLPDKSPTNQPARIKE
ncbi:MAG: HAD family hydrolase [Planctomycetales bacterium]|nr:HAD family hydrolase [Planctomycetales bacterium]